MQFSMAEMTRQKLAWAMNSSDDAEDATAFEPPDLGTEVRRMIVWDKLEDATDLVTEGGNIRWIYRQVYQVDPVETARAKAPAKGLLPVRFQLELPTGLRSYKVFPNALGQVA